VFVFDDFNREESILRMHKRSKHGIKLIKRSKKQRRTPIKDE
jgi:hypothetical protein